jgi:uncharacterized membrane protein YhaH (DUF805 family)
MTDPTSTTDTSPNTSPNLYAAPRADVVDIYPGAGETQPVHLFSAAGRIGRLRYICWQGVFALVFLAVSAIVMLMTLGMGFLANSGAMSMSHMGGLAALWILIIVVLEIVWLVFAVMLMIQRSHDMGWSGWSVLIMFAIMAVLEIAALIAILAMKALAVGVLLILLAIFIGLIWMVKPGTAGANRFGPPPAPTPTGVQVGAWIFIALGVLDVVGGGLQGLALMSGMR